MLAHQFVGGDVGLTRRQRQRVEQEAPVQAAHTLRTQDLAEGVQGAGVERRRPLLDLQPRADQAGGVDAGPGGQSHKHAQ